MSQPPLACSLSRDQLRARRADLLPGLVARAQRVEQIPGGVRLHLPSAPDALTTVARVVEAERQCCRFLSFTIVAEPDLGPVTLSVTAPPEAHGLIRDLVAPTM